MIIDLQKTHNKIKELPVLPDTRYENIFKLAKQDKYFFYNITKKVNFPSDLSEQIYFETYVNGNIPWTTFADQVYGDQNLWWLICLVNDVQNPVVNPEPGKRYKLINPTLVSRILAEINKQVL